MQIAPPLTINYSIPVFIGKCFSCGTKSFVCTLLAGDEVCYQCMDAGTPGHGNGDYAYIGRPR